MDEFDDNVDDFLDHSGVKGQKWGVRKAVSNAGTSTKAAVSSVSTSTKASVLAARAKVLGPTSPLTAKRRQEAMTAAKAAFIVGKSGVLPLVGEGVVPLSIATGVGLPVAAGVTLTMKLAADPHIRGAVVSAGKYTDSVVKDYGGKSMTAIKSVTPHITTSQVKSSAKKTAKAAVKGTARVAATFPEVALMS